MDRVKAALRIQGAVQGVFFRHSAKREALRLGLTGWVRNRSDGDVEAVAEGREEDVRRFIDWCRKGPPQARVDRVEIAEEPASNAFSCFQVEP